MLDLWDDLVRSRAFWLGYVGASCFGFTPREPAAGALRSPVSTVWVNVPFPQAFCLQFYVEKGAHALYLEAGGGAVALGSRDAAMDQTGHVFRWAEFEAITRFMNRQAGPTWANELLVSAYVAVTPDCADRLFDLRRRGMAASGLFRGDEADQILAAERAWLDLDFRWAEAPGLGWAAEGKHAAWSARHPRGDFDFALFNEFLDAVTAGRSGPGRIH